MTEAAPPLQPKRAVDVLIFLAHCSDRTLFTLLLAVRVSFLMYMLCCRRLTPLLTGRPSATMTVFDTSSTSDPADPFPEVTRWDVVHFYHIATYGYTHEADFAFFPFMPLLIRGTTYLLHVLVPALGEIVSVPMCLSAVNVTASAAAGVLLRRLTTLTFVGKEGLAIQQRSAQGPVAEEQTQAGLTDLLNERWRRCAVGTTLDAPRLDLGEAYPCGSEHEKTVGTDGRVAGTRTGGAGAARAAPVAPLPACCAAQLLRRRWRFVGAATLAWLVTPSMVFTVVLYTESLFALFTFAGIYAQVALSREEEAEMAREMGAAAREANRSEVVGDDTYYLVPEAVVRTLSVTADDGRCVYALRQHYGPAWRDVVSLTFFLLTATIRSNGFVSVGFMWYPLVLQALWPEEFQRRWRMRYAAACRQWRRGKGGDACSASVVPPTPSPRTVRLSTLPTRWPHPVRLFWTILFTGILLIPSTAMNWVAYTRFHALLSPAEKQALAGRFWRMYAHIQAKYWDCGPLHAYTLKNAPNVLIALPVGSLVVLTSVLVCRSFTRGYPRPLSTAANALPQQARTAWATFLSRIVSGLRLGLQSSNLTLLWVLTLIAFTVMHVQVVNRFVMACPALHWLFAYWWVRWPPQAMDVSHLLRRRKEGARGLNWCGSTVSFALLAYILLWNILGGYMFPNHLPWT